MPTPPAAMVAPSTVPTNRARSVPLPTSAMPKPMIPPSRPARTTAKKAKR